MRKYKKCKEKGKKREAYWEGGGGHSVLQGGKPPAWQCISQELERLCVGLGGQSATSLLPIWWWTDGRVARALDNPEAEVSLLWDLKRLTENYPAEGKGIWPTKSLGINKRTNKRWKQSDRSERIDDENASFKERYISEKSTEPETLRVDIFHFSLIFELYRSGNQDQKRRSDVLNAVQLVADQSWASWVLPIY